MTKGEAVEKLTVCQHDCDTEGSHIDADDILCDLLVSLGCADVVAAYHKISKWYA